MEEDGGGSCVFPYFVAVVFRVFSVCVSRFCFGVFRCVRCVSVCRVYFVVCGCLFIFFVFSWFLGF